VDVALVTGEIRYAYGEYIQAYQHLLQAAESATDAVLKNRCYTMAAKCCQQLGGEQWQDTEISMLKNASAALGTENSGVLQLLAEAWLRKGSAAGADTVACYTEALTCLQQLMDRGMQPFEVRLNTANVLYYLDRYDEAIPIYTALQADFPKDYRIPMHLAWLYLDQQTALPTEQRDYTQFGAAYNQADTLYAAAGIQDSEMLRLQLLAKQLQDAGWKW